VNADHETTRSKQYLSNFVLSWDRCSPFVSSCPRIYPAIGNSAAPIIVAASPVVPAMTLIGVR
jgi:hypothetical protein